MNKEMSLYFTLFETVSLFVSTFIVNFLVYVIITVAAFFYPSDEDTGEAGGGDSAGHAVEAAKLAVREVAGMLGV